MSIEQAQQSRQAERLGILEGVPSARFAGRGIVRCAGRGSCLPGGDI